MLAHSLDNGARIEEIVAPEQGDQFVVVALLDLALDDDVQRLDWLARRNQIFARPVVADVDGFAQFLDLALGQAVERRIGGVERIRHVAKDTLEMNAGRKAARTNSAGTRRRKCGQASPPGRLA